MNKRPPPPTALLPTTTTSTTKKLKSTRGVRVSCYLFTALSASDPFADIMLRDILLGNTSPLNDLTDNEIEITAVTRYSATKRFPQLRVV